MKTLRFFEPLPTLILNGQKDTTWRIHDDKDLQKGDIVQLVDKDRQEFGKAKIEWTKNTTFGNLSPEDTQGHETFNSTQEMLDTYSRYYGIPVTLETPIKIIKFKLL
ncbi:MAG TPA: ASCH domain-containing protein [Candidatus Levybacteria bacterium]|nr:ASCH domain-containing protein [Candidatus Levybacteria bacterium]